MLILFYYIIIKITYQLSFSQPRYWWRFSFAVVNISQLSQHGNDVDQQIGTTITFSFLSFLFLFKFEFPLIKLSLLWIGIPFTVMVPLPLTTAFGILSEFIIALFIHLSLIPHKSLFSHP